MRDVVFIAVLVFYFVAFLFFLVPSTREKLKNIGEHFDGIIAKGIIFSICFFGACFWSYFLFGLYKAQSESYVWEGLAPTMLYRLPKVSLAFFAIYLIFDWLVKKGSIGLLGMITGVLYFIFSLFL